MTIKRVDVVVNGVPPEVPVSVDMWQDLGEKLAAELDAEAGGVSPNIGPRGNSHITGLVVITADGIILHPEPFQKVLDSLRRFLQTHYPKASIFCWHDFRETTSLSSVRSGYRFRRREEPAP